MPIKWIVIATLIIAGRAPADESASYLIQPTNNTNWSLGCPLSGSADESAGSDRLGKYFQTTTHLTKAGVPLTETIRSYQNRQATLFSLTYDAAAPKPLLAFPDFDHLPAKFHVMSYRQTVFAPVAFEPVNSGSPWMIFDDDANTIIISPASHFLIQTIGGDARLHITSQLRDTVRNIPAGFTQQTLLSTGKGINRTWDQWGRALTDLQGATRPANDADTGLKYLGYWTDNGTYYYYNFNSKLGYGGTLLELAKHFRAENIPVKYMQLDSWWYFKSLTGPDGKTGKTKTTAFPPGEWNRYGGLLEYRAHPAVFPKGLQKFQQELDLPLITHNRWIDPASPYHQHYRISGFAPIDPSWWRDITRYLKSAGTQTYEQDWLSVIYNNSPDLFSTVNAGDEFLDSMAAACQDHGMTMQYCMAYPCFFLQGSKYQNLTTIRTSEDRLKRDRWHNFLYASRLASALKIWPWTDPYMSKETPNVLLSVLSAGIVGFGDEIGTEDKQNIFQAVRSDGVIVKPDVPIVPIDSAFIAEANGQHLPLVASTYTDHHGIKTNYILAFRIPTDPKTSAPDITQASFSPQEIGINGPAYLYDFLANSVQPLNANTTFTAKLGPDGFSYFIIAQPGESGIALFGDAGKFVSTGKQRIASLHQDPGKLTAEIIFASGESHIKLHGCCPVKPRISVDDKQLDTAYDAPSQHFVVDVALSPGETKLPDGTQRLRVVMESRR